jgi:hypothetical protein
VISFLNTLVTFMDHSCWIHCLHLFFCLSERLWLVICLLSWICSNASSAVELIQYNNSVGCNKIRPSEPVTMHLNSAVIWQQCNFFQRCKSHAWISALHYTGFQAITTPQFNLMCFAYAFTNHGVDLRAHFFPQSFMYRSRFPCLSPCNLI